MADKVAIALPKGITCVTANNPGPMTFRGTNSYVFGNDDTCCIVDPGPDGDERHLKALAAAVNGRTVEAVLLTHRHGDHSGLTFETRARFEAPLLAAASPERSYQASVDFANLVPDRTLTTGKTLLLAGHRIEVVATPGHTSDHLAYALPESGVLLSGDHVMGWSTTVVIPPDGSMRDYRGSLKKLLDRSEPLYLPGHGNPIDRPRRLVRNFLHHRRQREEMILSVLREAPATLDDLVIRLYPALDERLKRAAGCSVQAHLVELFEADTVAGPDPLTARGPFSLR